MAAWLATIEGARLLTGNPIYRRVFDFWLKVFAVSFGMGVVTGIVMAFQFGTNWGVLAQRTGSIQGPLLGHAIVDGAIIPADWWTITTGEVMRVRWPHMLLAAFLTTGMCVAATGAWYVLRGVHRAEARA